MAIRLTGTVGLNNGNGDAGVPELIPDAAIHSTSSKNTCEPGTSPKDGTAGATNGGEPAKRYKNADIAIRLTGTVKDPSTVPKVSFA